MNDCWNFFRYAEPSDIDEIISLVKKNHIWFSHLNTEHFIQKINNKECIYESGVLITFKIINIKTALGTFKVPAGNTILEQIIKNKKKSNSKLLYHVFTKFINCALGAVYLAVNNKNINAINFYKKMNMLKVSDTKLDYKTRNRTFVKGYIYKTNKKDLGRIIH